MNHRGLILLHSRLEFTSSPEGGGIELYIVTSLSLRLSNLMKLRYKVKICRSQKERDKRGGKTAQARRGGDRMQADLKH